MRNFASYFEHFIDSCPTLKVTFLPGNVDRPDQYLANTSLCQRLYESRSGIACRLLTGDNGLSEVTATHSQKVYDLLRPCTADEFTCTKSRQCVAPAKLCDGHSDCIDGSDESEGACVDFHLSNCSFGFFECANSGEKFSNDFSSLKITTLKFFSEQCVPNSKKCDFMSDCRDGSDEIDCQHEKCLYDEFACTNGECIKAAELCDGLKNCKDGSDEEFCSDCSKASMFRCSKSKLCIHKSKVCDQTIDCGNSDGSDETSETCQSRFSDFLSENEFKCPEGFFRCENGPKCISNSHLCNGKMDCDDESDEIGCHVGTCNEHDCEDQCTQVPYRQSNGSIVCQGFVPMGRICSCSPGSKRSVSDPTRCVDIDECLKPLSNNCSHICSNQNSGYQCMCQPGFRRQPILPGPSHNTTLVNPSAFVCVDDDKMSSSYQIVFAFADSVRAYQDGDVRTVIQWDNFKVQMKAMAMDPRNGDLYFIQKGRENLVKKISAESVAIGTDPIVDIVIDFIGSNLYLLQDNSLKVSSLFDVAHPLTIRKGLKGATKLAVNPLKGRLYLGEYQNGTASITMMPMDGSSFQDRTFFRTTSDVPISEMVVDFMGSSRIYFSINGKAYLGNYDGTNVQELNFGLIGYPTSFDIFQGSLIGLFSPSNKFHVVDKFGRFTSTSSNITGSIAGADMLQVYHPMKIGLPVDRPKPCLGSCPHLCLVTANGSGQCKCPDRHHLGNDSERKSCLKNSNHETASVHLKEYCEQHCMKKRGNCRRIESTDFFFCLCKNGYTGNRCQFAAKNNRMNRDENGTNGSMASFVDQGQDVSSLIETNNSATTTYLITAAIVMIGVLVCLMIGAVTIAFINRLRMTSFADDASIANSTSNDGQPHLTRHAKRPNYLDDTSDSIEC